MRQVIYVIGGLAFFLSGCVKNNSSVIADVDPSGWSAHSPAVIKYYNTDTLSLRKISLFLRTGNDIADSSLMLSVKAMTPDSLWYEEPFEAHLPAGIKNRADFKEYILPYREDALLSMKGNYIFSISVRQTDIKGIWNAGIIVEP